MTSMTPQAHLWLIVPAQCEIESEIVAYDEFRFVFGDRCRDGHTIEFERTSLKRFHAAAGELLARTDSSSCTSDHEQALTIPAS